MIEDREALNLVELILVGGGRALTQAEIQDRLPYAADVASLIATLSSEYEGRSIQIVEVENGRWAVRTRPEASDLCRALLRRPVRMSPAAMQTLAVVAYFQPVTRSDIERVRGVALSKGTLDVLVFAGWIKPGPRRATPGNPMTFLTTDKFLHHFNLQDLDQLPDIARLRSEGLLNPETGIDIGLRSEGADEDDLSA